ncbi:MAG: zinc-binding dehydrogenase [Nitratireductor sp.]
MTLPSRMKALVLTEGGYSAELASYTPESLAPFLAYEEVDVPRPAKGQVLIRMRCSSVNPSDVIFFQGNYGQPRIKGQPAGFEAVGDVVATGGGLMASMLSGKRVAFVAHNSGSWAEYVIADAATCIALRKDVRDEDGAAMIVNPLTAHAMFDLVKRSGSKAFVMTAASSQLCKLMASLARDEGYTAISVVRRDSQIEHLKELGAAHVLNCEKKDFADTFAAVCKSEKPVMLLDAVTGPVSSTMFSLMGPRARWVIYGRLTDEPTTLQDPGQFIFMTKQVEGFWLVNWMQNTPLLAKLRVVRTVQKRFATGAWQTEVAARVPLKDVHKQLPGLLKGENKGKILLVPDDYRP